MRPKMVNMDILKFADCLSEQRYFDLKMLAPMHI